MDKQGLRDTALREIEGVRWMPDWGQSAHRGHGARTARLVHLAPAHLGRADPLFVHKETGELHPRTDELIELVAKRVEKHGIEAWFALDPVDLLADEGRSTTRPTTPWMSGSTRA
jgi:isoleucyl-tRNA synthetase